MTHPFPSEQPRVRLVDVRLVGETEALYKVRHAGHVAELLHEFVGAADREHFVAIYLDARHRVTHVHTVSVGHLAGSLVHPREVFTPALRAAAAGMVLVHNHPSGDPDPSPEDHEVTRRLVAVGDLVGIRVLDHVVIGDGRYVSFLERGWLPS